MRSEGRRSEHAPAQSLFCVLNFWITRSRSARSFATSTCRRPPPELLRLSASSRSALAQAALWEMSARQAASRARIPAV